MMLVKNINDELDRLLPLFAAAAAVRCDVTLFEQDEPAAEFAARMFARENGLRVELRNVDDNDPELGTVVYVMRGNTTIIRILKEAANVSR